MTILSKILHWANIFGKNWNFRTRHVHVGKKWQFRAKYLIGPTLEIEIFILYMSAVVKNDNFEQNPGSGQRFWKNWNFQSGHVRGGQTWQLWAKYWVGPELLEKLKFSSSTCPRWSKMAILSKNLGSGHIYWNKWNFYPRHVRCGQKWQFLAKSWMGPKFLEKLKFSSSTCPRWSKIQFWAKSWIGPHLLVKIKFLARTCPWWSKMTILSKILGRANIFGKIEIFILGMSAVVKNDNFEQNPWSGQHFWKNWNFHPRHVRSGQK